MPGKKREDSGFVWLLLCHSLENCRTDEIQRILHRWNFPETAAGHVKGYTTTGSPFLKRTLKEALWEPWQSNCIWEFVKASNTSTMRARGEKILGALETVFLIGDQGSPTRFPKLTFRARNARPRWCMSRSDFCTTVCLWPGNPESDYRDSGQMYSRNLFPLVPYSYGNIDRFFHTRVKIGCGFRR